MNESPVFIVGCPRSGTTLLRDLLRSHPRLTFPFESHFIPSFFRRYGDPRSEREAIELARRILHLEWIRSWNLPVEPAAFAGDRSFGQVLSRLYGIWALREGKPRWGDKTPHYVINIPVLREIFPSAKVIHIIRDGRDVALSWLRIGLEPRNLFTAACLWKRYVSAGCQAGKALSRDYYFEVRYESLLSRPAETMQAVCDFINEPYSEAVLKPNTLSRVFRQPIIGKQRIRKELPLTINQTNTAKWKTAMSLSDRAMFESVAGDCLASLGYETEGIARPIGKPEEWIWKVHHKFWWTVTRLNMQGNYRWLATAFKLRRTRR